MDILHWISAEFSERCGVRNRFTDESFCVHERIINVMAALKFLLRLFCIGLSGFCAQPDRAFYLFFFFNVQEYKAI